MKIRLCIVAGLLALAGAATGATTSTALPLASGSHTVVGDATRSAGGLVQKVSGCHRDAQNHMVFAWGYQAWHRHSKNCTPKPANPPVYNPVQPGYPGYNPYPVQPGYPGYNPYPPQPGYPGYNPNPGYCHYDWQNHFHPGWSGGWHKHVGPNCQPVQGRQWRGGSKKGCVNILGVWICS